MDVVNKSVVISQSNDDAVRLLKMHGYQVEVRGGSSVLDMASTVAPFTRVNSDVIVVKKARNYLISHLDEKLLLEDVARACGVNRSKLALIFRRVVGVGVFEWLRNYRMSKAKILLMKSDLSVQAVGLEVGYENSANFSSAYKKVFNVSPREQRKLSSHFK